MKKKFKVNLKLTKEKQAKVIGFMEVALVAIIILCFIMVFLSRGSLNLR